MRPRSLVPSSRGGALPTAAADALDTLLAEARHALAGDGRVVFVLDPTGSSRSPLLRELRARLQAVPAAPTVISEACANDQRDVWLRIAQGAARRKRLKNAAVTLLPDWLALVPVAGKILSAVSATALAVAGPRATNEPAAAASAPAAVRDLLARTAGGLVVLLDRAEAADTPDLAGIAALVHHLAGRPILLVVAMTPARGGAAAALRDIMLEAERVGCGRRILLAPAVAPAQPAETLQLALAQEDVHLLAAAARQGTVFGSLRLAQDAGIPELEVEERLSRLIRGGILEDRGVHADEDGELTGVYAFRSEILPDRIRYA